MFQVYLFSCFIASSGDKEGIDDIDFGELPGSSSETKVKTIDSGNTPIKSFDSNETPIKTFDFDETPVKSFDSDETPVKCVG